MSNKNNRGFGWPIKAHEIPEHVRNVEASFHHSKFQGWADSIDMLPPTKYSDEVVNDLILTVVFLSQHED